MTVRPPRGALEDAALCLVFFTRLPLPQLDLRGRTLAQAIWAAPVAGLAIAILAGLVYGLATEFGLAAGPAAALALSASLLATGGLHEDGLSDVADGFGGGRTRETKLEIMRDSRIGSYGAAALGLSLLLRWSALSEFGHPAHVLLALVAAHMASRGMAGAFMHLSPPARADGLAAGAGAVDEAGRLSRRRRGVRDRPRALNRVASELPTGARAPTWRATQQM